jgi:hypothetical protein
MRHEVRESMRHVRPLYSYNACGAIGKDGLLASKTLQALTPQTIEL